MPFSVTWMDLEIIVLSEVGQMKTNIIYHICRIQKNDTNEFIYKTERDSQILKTNMFPRGKVQGKRDELGDWD